MLKSWGKACFLGLSADSLAATRSPSSSTPLLGAEQCVPTGPSATVPWLWAAPVCACLAQLLPTPRGQVPSLSLPWAPQGLVLCVPALSLQLHPQHTESAMQTLWGSSVP